ncbi:protein-glutamate methylesterase/protein-glutamine glutaminase [Petroclostridium xylanilyticum]|uniref:protein-glutamate methylesterase/protein-glutamine glutaminase n=1 Tax=Petroclostridium xylanilyticum TaxID=1792311 RepID=UPI000B98556F|nr:chemotaxis response regulator protein-glutamate methylesterase [Petroclostridium xylanilyticum]
MPIRVMIVDDSAFMRKVITDVLRTDNEIEVIYTAKDGKDALEKIKQLSPDVITLDVEMPVMNGLDCLQHIMNYKPIPVIMVSGLTSEGADATIKALELGAVDFITKPSNIFEIGSDKFKKEITEKVKVAKNTRVHPHTYPAVYNKRTDIVHSSNLKKIVAIGTSTGGPRALQQIIPFIPGNIPAAFIVVQHMPPGFTKSFAMRLDGMSELTVKEAEDGDKIKAGCVYIAPGDYHIVFDKETRSNDLIIRLNKSDPVGGHRPSVNVMMNSLSDTGLRNIIGVIMTGMGSDGCEGLKSLKEINKAFVIAQDEKSCVVYGMPKAAVQAGIVDKIVSLNEISNEIIKLVGV